MNEPQLKNGSPTGMLRDGLMEVECYILHEGRQIGCGTRWIEITDEQRRLIEGQRVSVSMGASAETLNAVATAPDNDYASVARSRGLIVEHKDKDPLSDYRKMDEPGWVLPPGGSTLKFPDGVVTCEVEGKAALLTVPPGTSEERQQECLTRHNDSIRAKGNPKKEEPARLAACVLTVDRPYHTLSIDPADIPEFIEKFQAASIPPKGTKLRGEYKEFQMTGVSMTADGPQIMGYGKIVPTDTELSEQEVTGTTTISSLNGKVELSKEDVRAYTDAQLEAALGPRDAEVAKAMMFKFTPEQRHGDRRTPEHSGGNVNYYSVEIKHPKRPERTPYVFEVEDLIQALNMGFHEGTILKSLIRAATERELGLLKQGGDAIRDAQKIIHSGKELLRARELARDAK